LFTLNLYDFVERALTIDRCRASLAGDAARDSRQAQLDLLAGEPLRLHVYLDGSIVEVFANGRLMLTSRVYPARADSQGLRLLASRGIIHVRSIDVWTLQSIWEGS
jgi:beta-fructofuranosidase